MTSNTPTDLVLSIETIDRVQISLACQHCGITMDFVEALVIEGVLEHHPDTLDEWQLTQTQYGQLRRAARLHHDLGINPPGIALALDLLAQLESNPS